MPALQGGALQVIHLSGSRDERLLRIISGKHSCPRRRFSSSQKSLQRRGFRHYRPAPTVCRVGSVQAAALLVHILRSDDHRPHARFSSGERCVMVKEIELAVTCSVKDSRCARESETLRHVANIAALAPQMQRFDC